MDAATEEARVTAAAFVAVMATMTMLMSNNDGCKDVDSGCGNHDSRGKGEGDSNGDSNSFECSLTQAPSSNVSMIKISALLKGNITKLLGDAKLVRTFAGCLKMQDVVTMQDLRLPKFDKNRHINQQKVSVFDNDSVKHDIILGTNFLSKTGIKLTYSEGNMEWFDCSIPLCPPGGLDSKDFNAMEDMFHIHV
jgi:hypothetical protein